MVNLEYVNGKGQIESFTNETLFVLSKDIKFTNIITLLANVVCTLLHIC